MKLQYNFFFRVLRPILSRRDCHKQYYSLITRPWYLRNYMISQDIISDSAVLGNRTRIIISISSLFKIGQETRLFEFCIFNKTSSWRLKSESSSELLLLSALALLKPLSWREKNCGLYWNLSIERGFRVSFPFRSGDISHKSKLQICEPVFTKSIGALGFPVNNRINQARKDTLPINQPKLTQDLVDHSSHHPSFPYQQPAQQHPVQLFGDDGGKV